MKVMNYFYGLLLVLLLNTVALAQYPGEPLRQVTKNAGSELVNGKITGVVIDSITQAPVEFANVALVDVATDKPIDGAVCDVNGTFTINKIKEGSYAVVISFIGFENKRIPVEISEKNEDVGLGRIILAPTAEILKEVVVEGTRNLIEEKVDRTVYNAENDVTTKGGDATDVLKRVPMLSVDLDGNVTMRGSSNITVLINNKPSTIAASSVADALKMIPADQIKSVEVITSPSAKYDAEGSGGIINIITKKNTLQGVNLNVDVSAGMRGSNLGLNGGYRKKNMGFSLGGFGRTNYNVNGEFENTQTTTIDGIETTNTQRADTRNEGLFGNYTLGWDYDLNKNNSLTASVRYGLRNNKTFQDNLITTSTDETRNTVGDINTRDESANVDASLNFTHTFETPQREFSILTQYSRNNRTNDFMNNSVDVNDVLSRRKNLNQSYNQEITFQADYQTPIGKTQILEFGGKSITRKVSSDYTYFQAIGDGDFSPSEFQQPNVFDYDQNVTGGYLSYTLSFLKSYSIKAGGRYEYTTIDANFRNPESAGEDVSDIPSYGAFVPSVNVSKKLKSGNMVKLAYNRRLQRPSIQFLNPNIQSTNNLNSTQGNPNLAPEYTDNFEISYSTYIKGSSLNFSGFVRNTDNGIQTVRDVTGVIPEDPDTIRTTYKNIGKEQAFGVNIFANVNVGNKLSLNGGMDLYYAVMKNNMPNTLYNASNEGWVVGYRLFGNYNLGKGWGAQFFGFYRGRQIQLQGTQGGFGIYSLGLRKEFNEKKGTIGFGAENFFTPNFRIKNENSSPILVQNSINTLHLTNFKITFSYRIGKMSFDAPKRRRSINNDDLKDGGGGDNGGGGAPQQSGPQQQGPPANRAGQQGQRGK
jgi:outer membrane receptor protein involved in Fe transport